jgi:hypothetical protein
MITRELRNRIGHHHKVWTLDLPKTLDTLYRLGELIDPDLEKLLKARSRVENLLSTQPS